MAYLNDGNLARKYTSAAPQYKPIYKAVPEVVPTYDPRKQKERERKARELQERRLQYNRLYKASGIQRRRKVLLTLMTIGVIAALFLMLMVRQSRVVTANFNNTRLQNGIDEMKIENVKAREKLINELNFESVAAVAQEKLGLRKPAQSQRIKFKLPVSDRVIVYYEGKAIEFVDNSNEQGLKNLERYMAEKNN